ncbi:MAG: AAA family ATPase [Gordonia sp. (in: high G+C Gram-positive bacteria)]|uniref:ATP-dependent nuclease n=1 Tax=Gordonia sp. (in: high G+C Gram-positive bacteria) TaxID=84139 RepID=UPI003C788105
MRLTRLAVVNHSRLEDVDLEVRQHLVLVGPNDVGKSSLLRCLNLLLGASTAQLYSWLTPDDLREQLQPLVIEADLVDFSSADEAVFPDEINVDASGSKSLTLRMEATFDSNQTLVVERHAQGAGHNRQISRAQLGAIGWKLLGATAMSRDLRDGRRSALDEILEQVELGAEQADFDALATELQEKLEASVVLEALRGDLAEQLSKALPDAVDRDDLRLVPGATADSDVLSDVRLQVAKDGVSRNLSEQSDGMRALYALALYDLVSVGANVVGIDEPEVHLHPTSQRSLARLLQSGPNQKVLATHSADIVGAFQPDCIVAVRAGGQVVQPAANFLSDDERMVVHWWVRDKLEPLTARRVIAVEGVSDRIIVEAVGNLTGRNLDRLGVSLVETDGAGDMGAIIKLFGNSGFDIPLSLLIDSDAAVKTAKTLGIAEADLGRNSVYVSDPDLEAEYVQALGPDVVWSAIEKSRLFSSNERENCSASGPDGTRTAQDVADFCRRKGKGYKVRAAMIVAPLITQHTARTILSINRLLDEIAA